MLQGFIPPAQIAPARSTSRQIRPPPANGPPLWSEGSGRLCDHCHRDSHFAPCRNSTTQNSPRRKKIVIAISEQDTACAKEGHQRDISRSNYDFVFLREQNFGVIPEYVLHIIPKRKEKGLFLGGGCLC